MQRTNLKIAARLRSEREFPVPRRCCQKTHAPNLVIFFEAGGVAPQLPTMPISVGDSRTIHRALMATSMAEVMQFCQRGLMDYTFLSGARSTPTATSTRR